MDTVKKQHVYWVDVAKWMCAVMVVMVHVKYTTNAFYLFNRAFFDYSPVPLFFLLSGFFFSRKISKSTQKIHDGLVYTMRLLPPFVFSACVAALLCLFLGAFPSEYLEYPALWKKVVTFVQYTFGIARHPVNVPLWFLRDLIILSLLSSFIIKLPLKWLIALTFILLSLSNDLMHSYYLRYIMPETSGFFMLGLCLGRCKGVLEISEKLARQSSGTFALIFILFNASLIFTMIYHETNAAGFWVYISTISRAFGAWAIIVIAVLFSDKFPKIAELASKWSEATFFIFAFHYPFQRCFLALMNKLHPNLTNDIPALYVDLLSSLSAIPTVMILMGIFMFIRCYAPFLLPLISTRTSHKTRFFSLAS